MDGMHEDHGVPQAVDRNSRFIQSKANLRPMGAAMNSVDKAPEDGKIGRRFNKLVRDLMEHEGLSEAEAKAKATIASEQELRGHANSLPARAMDPHQLENLCPLN